VTKKKKLSKNEKLEKREKKPAWLTLPEEIKRYIFGVIIILLALILALSFFEKAGIAGKAIFSALNYLIGKSIFLLPLALVLGSLVFFFSRYEKFLGGVFLAITLLILGISVILECFSPGLKQGGALGHFISLPFLKLFGNLVTEIIFAFIIICGGLIFGYLLKQPTPGVGEAPTKPSLFKKIFAPKFKVKEIEPPTTFEKEARFAKETPLELKTKPVSAFPSKVVGGTEYPFPPLDLLEEEKGTPSAGDVRTNSAIIKKTLENFDIPVEMSEINIGPTVTQYTLKPADGIKLSKITTLSNDLALALASHPIRIEAPIPGKSLVGIEVPNRLRTQVRLRNLIASPQFQNAPSNLTFPLGRDVSGNPVYADLAKMPHLLVGGSTGSGKTIFLNSLILSLLYRNSPEILRFILIDPKRVEFPVYNELPHLLCPVILEPQRTVNALKWLISEMERRFDLLSEAKARDIAGYNEIVKRTLNAEYKNAEKFQSSEFKVQRSIMPYIVLIVDELADLMAARGKEVEAGIVRLAQMARAVGIHLVVATQRPSVEVITGLIKANITSRVTFQVASQVDSRTVLDMAGAEKLLGLGDLLFVSAEISKPVRIQGAYVSEKEVKRVVNYINSHLRPSGFGGQAKIGEEIFKNQLAEDLEKGLEIPESTFETEFETEEDPLYEEAKRVVIEAKKASASLLQRKLRIGYARAARLIDMMEDRGVVGPADGAKPREVYFKTDKEENEDDWQKV
jgi:S-DNA-T family DNA segregation ATPase FtsK/SpoIIIE